MPLVADIGSEYGVIRIPRREWGRLVSTIRQTKIREQDLQYERAADLFVYLVHAGERRRNFNWREAYRQAAACIDDPNKVLYKALFMRKGIELDRPRAPRRLEFAVPRWSNVFSFGLLTLHLSSHTHTIVWEVTAGVGATDRAHADPHVLEVLHALRDVQWSERTGGVIVRTLGRSSKIVLGFGPIGEKRYGIQRAHRG